MRRIALPLIRVLASLVGGCAHPTPVASPNHAIEYVSILDHNVRCEDWRTAASPVHAAMCVSGDSLFWCVAPPDSKPKCELLFAPPKKETPATSAPAATTPVPAATPAAAAPAETKTP